MKAPCHKEAQSGAAAIEGTRFAPFAPFCGHFEL
jgi:hypothetical protein